MEERSDWDVMDFAKSDLSCISEEEEEEEEVRSCSRLEA
jgi:hypothetical protein